MARGNKPRQAKNEFVILAKSDPAAAKRLLLSLVATTRNNEEIAERLDLALGYFYNLLAERGWQHDVRAERERRKRRYRLPPLGAA